jgi:hypothetical protein
MTEILGGPALLFADISSVRWISGADELDDDFSLVIVQLA